MNRNATDSTEVRGDLIVCRGGSALEPGRNRDWPALGRRSLIMLGAFLAYTVAELLGKLMLVAQLVWCGCAGRPNDCLVRLGECLAAQIQIAWRYLLFCDEAPPWPISRWTGPSSGNLRWR